MMNAFLISSVAGLLGAASTLGMLRVSGLDVVSQVVDVLLELDLERVILVQETLEPIHHPRVRVLQGGGKSSDDSRHVFS